MEGRRQRREDKKKWKGKRRKEGIERKKMGVVQKDKGSKEGEVWKKEERLREGGGERVKWMSEKMKKKGDK